LTHRTLYDLFFLQIHVAQQGLSIQTAATGVAAECIGMLGGLTLHQLRWIFSSFAIGELDHSGWDVASVPFDDGDDSTHLWSELNGNCTATEIIIAGPPVGSAAFDFFKTHVLTAAEEEPREYHTGQNVRELESFMQESEAAISFFQMYDMLSVEYGDLARTLSPVAIMNDHHDYVKPNANTFETGEYPVLRDIYLGINDDPNALEVTRPFLEFGLSEEGSKVLKDNGFWPIREYQKFIMYTRLQSQHGLQNFDIREHCGPPDGSFSIAGSTTVAPVSHMWAKVFKMGCRVSIDLDGGGSSSGAGRVCGNLDHGKPVDIGNMSREWKSTEGQIREGGEDFVLDCVEGYTKRSTVQIDVALDGISVVMPQDGAGHRCIELLGGLTKDQLRWIFSSYDESKLTETGWNPSSLKNSDGNSETHLWRELDVRCDAAEIALNGGTTDGGTFTIFTDYLLTDKHNGEAIAQDRVHGYFAGEAEEILLELLKNDGSIGFDGYHYYFNNQALFWAAPIENTEGKFISPSLETIGDGTYPMVQSLYMNLLNDKASLEQTTRLIEFGLYHPELIEPSGYVAVQGNLREEMLRRIYDAPYAVEEIQGDDDEEVPLAVIASVVSGVFALLCTGIYVCYRMYDSNNQYK